MAAPLGNQFWRNRLDMSVDGRKLSVQEVIDKLSEYIDRCVNDKLKEQQIQKIKISRDEEQIEKVDCDKMIGMSIWGACVVLGIDDSTWKEWKKDEKYSAIITRAEHIFKSYNIEGSMAGLLNPNLTARIEGLKESHDLSSTDGTMTPKPAIQVINSKTAEELNKLIDENN